MKRIPDFPPKAFYRIRPPKPQELDDMIDKGTTGIVDAELARKKCTKGHGLMVASWEVESEHATVFAIGVVTGVDTSGRREVEWTRGPLSLERSTRGGNHFWSQPDPTFRFANSVAEDLGLKGFFSKHCKDPFAAFRIKTS
jgi:hypothetical protein